VAHIGAHMAVITKTNRSSGIVLFRGHKPKANEIKVFAYCLHTNDSMFDSKHNAIQWTRDLWTVFAVIISYITRE
jgi:hypothetical protein